VKKALFLDRDGIINIDYGYVSKIENFTFSKDIFSLIHLFEKKNYLCFIVTNQSGIGRGYYSKKDFQNVTHYMLNIFKSKHITIEEVCYCPHSPEENCRCRKPATGMIEDILQKYSIDLSHSWMIGDKQSDIDFAKNANIAHTIAIKNSNIKNSDYFFSSISSCVAFLEENQAIISS
jgi:D-glycero-D-manno-heptose 1,7-bisphosphate phosphatase